MVPKNPATRARINRNGSHSSGSEIYPVTPDWNDSLPEAVAGATSLDVFT